MEPTPEQAAEGAVIIDVLAAVLDRLVSSNAALALSDTGQVTKFHALKAPGIGIRDYIQRIYKFAFCSNECYILALIYIDRLIQRNNFLLTELNVHRVVITAILLAAKFFDDAYYNNAYYAKVGGVLVSEMNGLEVDFLFRINFSLRVTPELFVQYKDELIPQQQQQQQQPPVALYGYPSQPMQPVAEHQSLQHETTPVSSHYEQSIDRFAQQQHQGQQQNVSDFSSSDSMDMEATNAQSDFPADESNSIVRVEARDVSLSPTRQLETASNQAKVLQHNCTQMSADEYASGNFAAIEYVTNPAQRVDTCTNASTCQAQNQLLHADPVLQRANSLPVSYPSHAGKCAPQPYSAPMVAMLPVNSNAGTDHYLLLGSNLMPIQNTLVHHHHGMQQLHQQPTFHHQNARAAYGVGRDLIAGHY